MIKTAANFQRLWQMNWIIITISAVGLLVFPGKSQIYGANPIQMENAKPGNTGW